MFGFKKDPEPTCEQARQIVDEIAQRNGIITDEDRAATPPAVLRALQSVRTQLGRHLHPWTPCDTPDVRRDVVFQLISSTRSLHYNWAKKQGKEPYFSLDVSPDCMIIDTNDDGCLKSDVVRLSEYGVHWLPSYRTCNLYDEVLLSTSRIAREAHVQSGPFSFALGTRSPGDRLGFATPVNKDPASLPEGVRTRIILYPVLPEGFTKLVHEFKDIADNGFVLLDPDDARQPRCRNFVFIARLENFQITRLTYDFQVREGILEVTKTYPGLFTSPLRSTERFLLYKPTIPSSSSDKVALLFPIDQDSWPVRRSRKAYHIVGSFAFPISREEFSFIVCATVTMSRPVTDADIDTSTLLQDCVLNSFCSAVSFCQDHSMPYEWVQYIPKQSSVSPAWHKTVQGLIENLRVAPVFQSQNGGLKSLSSLRYLSPEHYSADDEPLFGASDDEHYLSTKYSAYLDCLKPLGLQEVSDREVLERLNPILTKPLRVLPSSNLRKGRMSLILRLLIGWLRRDPNNTLATGVRNIPLIELSNGSFVRGNDLNLTRSEADLAFANDAVYFPTDTNGNDIPRCLDILTVSEEAVRDDDQKELFRLLGVRCASPELVMRRISDHSHATYFVPTAGNRTADFMHILCYVYDSCAKDDRLKTPCLMVFDKHCLRRPVCRDSCPRYIPSDVYLRTDGTYGTEAIAKRLDSGSLFSPRLPLLHPTFLYPNLISKTHIDNDTWGIWLEKQGITRQVPRLTHWNNRKQLSDLFNAIISNHPDILLGVLGRYWDTYGAEIKEEPLIASAIKGAKVPTSNGLLRLDECYFPIPEFCNMVEAVSITLNINFLKLPGNWGLGSEREWGFLRELGVSGGGETTFIKVVKDRLLSTMTLEDAKPHFFELYRWISERLSEDVETDSFEEDSETDFFELNRTILLDSLREFLKVEELVYIPNSGDGAKLVCLDQCFWHGPSWLRTGYALAFHKEYAGDSKIWGLFLDILFVEDADWGTYMTELLHLQDVGVGLIEETQRIYKAIMEDIEDEEDWNSLRNRFNLHEMIYVPDTKQWYAPQQCIWASFSTGDQIGISNVYPDMESFFVEKLQVQPPSIPCYISRIRDLCKDKGRVTEVIEALHHINHLEPTMSDLDRLKLINFLPIEGTEEDFYWGSVTSDFFIIDRDGWPMLFYGKVPTVQLRLAEVRELAPLLKSLGLENRFISICATRKTSVSEMPSQPSLHLTTDFRQRSSGLSRCIAYYNDGNVSAARELYDTFRKAVVYETEHIVGKCTLTSRSGSSTSLQTYSRLHMGYVNGKLSIFVPRDEKERLICYATQLPESLISSLDIKHPAAHGIFATVLQVPVEIVDGILEIHGIPEVFDLDPASPVIIDDLESDYEDAPEEVFVPRASIAWGGKDQLLASERSELQLVLRSKDMHITEYRSHSDRHEMVEKEHADE